MSKSKSIQRDPLHGTENSLELELSDLYTPFSKYTPDQKLEAVMCFVLTGNSVHASKLLESSHGLKIPAKTIREWKVNADWWPDAYAECRKQKQEELDGVFTQFIHGAIEQVADRVSGGDYVMTKQGDVIRKPMNGRDIALCAAIFFDKRQLLRGDPTARVEKTSESDRLEKLENKFKEMAGMKKEWNAKVIDIDVEEVEED